jgi:hypothetical protein
MHIPQINQFQNTIEYDYCTYNADLFNKCSNADLQFPVT